MKKRPHLLRSYAFFFLLIAISFPLQIMGLYGHSILESEMVFNKITYLNWAVIGLCLINARFVYDANKMLKYSLPLLLLVIALNNYFVAKMSLHYSLTLTTISTLAFGIIGFYIFFSKEKRFLNQPNMRWWLAPKRFKRTLPVWIQGPMGSPLLSKTFNISKSGAFLSHTALASVRDELTSPIKEGDEIALTLGLSGQKDFSCQAEVIRLTKPSGIYPAGLGIRFKNMTLANRFILNQILKDTAAIGA